MARFTAEELEAKINKWHTDRNMEPPVGAQAVIAKIAKDRFNKEGAGVLWTDPVTSDMIHIDTTFDSQARFSAASTAIANGLRANADVWKCAKITADGPELMFRPTDNATILEWSGLVVNHVQKCFNAEANAVAKVMSGDLTVTFEDEFNALA
jgi:hypothetical protein